MKMGIVIFVAVALVTAGTNAQSPAWPEPIAKRLQELTQRFIHCSAVFSVLAFVIHRNDDLRQSDAARRYIRYSDLMHVRGAKLAAEVNQEPEAIKRQWETWAKSLLAEMDNQSPNFTLILSKYRDSCTALHEDAARHTRTAIFGQ